MIGTSLTPRVKKVLALASKEAKALNQPTRHGNILAARARVREMALARATDVDIGARAEQNVFRADVV